MESAVNIVWSALIVVVATAAAIAVMLAVRRRAPEGSYFADSDRAAGIFGVIATGFSVLLGFLIFLGFESYDASRAGAETEALTVAQQIQTAQTLPAEVGAPLTGQLVCYARSVIHDEWPRLEDGTLGEDINPWGVAMFQTMQHVELSNPQQEAVYGKWLDQTSDREAARQDRIHGAAGLMPTPLWIALFFISAVVLLYLLGFADSSERAWVQGMFMGSVVAVITTLLLLLSFLDSPFRGDVGGLQPVAMKRTELLIDQQLTALGGDVTIPCDDAGNAA
jgi:amino acid transporter